MQEEHSLLVLKVEVHGLSSSTGITVILVALLFNMKIKSLSSNPRFLFEKERAKSLAHAVAGEALPYEYLDRFRSENRMILANASAIGMKPNSDQTPISKVLCFSHYERKRPHILINKLILPHACLGGLESI